AAFREALEQGLAWGEAKKQLCDRIDAELGPMRERYAEFIARPDRLEDILQAGAQKARRWASPFIGRLREAVGLRSVVAVSPRSGAKPVAGADAAGAPQRGKAKDRPARFV